MGSKGAVERRRRGGDASEKKTEGGEDPEGRRGTEKASKIKWEEGKKCGSR